MDDAASGGPVAEDDAPGTQWLSGAEKEAWTGAVSLMPGRLEAPLVEAGGLSLFEYLTRSHMSEAPDRRLVMSELAYLTNGSLPRLSNVMKRFEARGWAERHRDPDDRRCTIASLTETGYAKVVEAAPAQVRSVREQVLAPWSLTDQGALARIAANCVPGPWTSAPTTDEPDTVGDDGSRY